MKFVDGKTSSANVPHLNVWGLIYPQPKTTRVFGVHRPLGPLGPLGPIHNKDARFFCCGNSAADISKSHMIYPQQNFRSRKNARLWCE